MCNDGTGPRSGSTCLMVDCVTNATKQVRLLEQVGTWVLSQDLGFRGCQGQERCSEEA